MSIIDSLSVSVSGMTAQRQRVNTISENLANANTTRTPQERSLDTATQVKVVGIVQDTKPPILRYEPGHPDANEEGYVAMPNINTMQEMVNLMEASRSYEANVAAFNASKSMWQSALDLGRGMG